ncbi:hypothetical protein [Cryptosporangium sp. NPDC048952]|uniref:hypothetical protein n=1 Tax=Cryptosporangium sp. NPDC048952 TaxID=3363961 RepID=UPI0037161B9F
MTATANAVSVSWEMGDGGVVECDGPGTPYTPDAGLKASPDCGYVYARSSRSQPGGVWTVLGTTTWEVAWQTVGGGPSGVVETTASTETTVRIDELQVVTQ